uniref:Uncharacterized protein n=1 Tax=Trypanosoma congolense (strain IL3000) TaxID=1068625 RepID=G0UZJ3_TRYCI|nr:conserved hypothetical protein [Trypanosoma congolense IL3000]
MLKDACIEAIQTMARSLDQSSLIQLVDSLNDMLRNHPASHRGPDRPYHQRHFQQQQHHHQNHHEQRHQPRQEGLSSRNSYQDPGRYGISRNDKQSQHYNNWNGSRRGGRGGRGHAKYSDGGLGQGQKLEERGSAKDREEDASERMRPKFKRNRRRPDKMDRADDSPSN